MLILREILLRNDRRRAGAALRRRGPADAERRTGPVDRRRTLRYAGMGLFCLGLAVPARAQIYTWRDANDHLVLSNRPNPAAGTVQRTFAVPLAPTVRATRAIVESRSLLTTS